MKIIITGGTGLIGGALAEDLAMDGHEVIVLSRSSKRANNISPGIRSAKWDGRTAQGWGHLAESAGAIVNLAGENVGAGRWNAQRKRVIIESRLNAGAAVMQAIRQAENKPGMVLQASGVGYYGISDTASFGENAVPADDFQGRICQDWEASTQPVEELGVRRVVTRSGVVLSVRAGALPRMLLPFKLFVGGPLGSGRQWLSWVHLEDEVRALRFLIDNPEARGVFNISAQPVTNRQFAQALGKAMHRPAFIPVPAFVLRFLFGEMSTMILDGQRVSSQRLLDHGFNFRFPDIDSAFKDILKRK